MAAASEDLDALQQQKTDLEAEFSAEMKALEGSADPLQQAIETIPKHPRKTDIDVRLVALVWHPHWKIPGGA